MNRRRFLAGLPSSLALLAAGRVWTGCDAPAAARLPPAPTRHYDYGLSYLPSYGQSLSLGERGSPALSTVPRFDSLMFAGGLIAQGRSSNLALDYGALVPLVENDSLVDFDASLIGIANPGETPVSGTVEAIKELMQSEDGLGTADRTAREQGSCPGHGAKTGEDLARGTIPYNRLVYEATQAAALAKSMGLTFGVPCVTWMQGEEDVPTDPVEYTAELAQLFADLDGDLRAISGQSKPVEFLLYQTAVPGSYPIACAQYELAQTMANVHIAAPVYPLPTDGAPWNDRVHLANLSYKTMGAYFGSAFKRIVVNGEAWLPLSPAQVSASGQIITLTLNVQGSAKVVADQAFTTTTLSIKPSLGFTLLDAAGNVLNIDGGVTVTGPDQIAIAAPVPIQAGFVLQYGNVIDGFGGGNIRDDFGEQYVFDGGGLNVPMHNWLTVFSYRFP